LDWTGGIDRVQRSPDFGQWTPDDCHPSASCRPMDIISLSFHCWIYLSATPFIPSKGIQKKISFM